jgi:hypothetical protein
VTSALNSTAKSRTKSAYPKSISDQLTIDRINELVKQIKAQKAALHPEQE